MRVELSSYRRDPIHTLEELEDLLSEPTDGVMEMLARLPGDFVLLGVGGKMGPSMARMLHRASEAAGTPRRIIGVSRFSSPGVEDALRLQGIETLRCDLLDAAAVDKLPEAPNVIYLAGRKFSSMHHEPLLWAMNTYVPTLVCRRFSGSRLLVFSTGNVYGPKPVAQGGSLESDPLNPVGEYAMSCVGRERLFEHFSRTLNIPMAFIRLNYAAEMRYGVLADLARKVAAGDPVSLTTGHFNTLWQGDACAMALQALQHATSPPFLLNVTGPELLSVSEVCQRLAELLGREVTFKGREAATALLSNAQLCQGLFGLPRVTADQLIQWTAQWVKDGGITWNKPTQFDTRSGQF